MDNFIINFMQNFGYIGVLLLILVENIFPPIPSELILTFSGFMTTYTKLKIPLLIGFSLLGSVLGAIVLYYVGKILNKERLIKLVSSKNFKWLGFKPNDIEKADEWFDKKGNITVFFCRFIPIVRSLISIPAGMSEMPMPKFLIYTTIGSLIWNTIFIYLGSIMGENWTKIVSIADDISHIVLIVIIVVFLIVAYLFYNSRRKKGK